ncbi:UNVERIFIED_ORG: hypothetical protein J2Y84_004628 [Pseudomonas reinekei]|nr:hypothetical protein [Pseudomonas reinekei]
MSPDGDNDICRSWLASDDFPEYAIAGKPAPTGTGASID